MKAGIHPDYRPVPFLDTAADVYFLIGPTAHPDRTHPHTDANTYPHHAPPVSSPFHPVHTCQ